MHQMGSCRMGSSPDNSVTNSQGHCWEVEGLYVADASCFPTATGTVISPYNNLDDLFTHSSTCARYVCRMLDTRLPRLSKVMLFGQVKGSNPPGRPRKIWNDIVLSDFQQLNIRCPYRDAQDKPAWRDRTCATHT